MTLRELILRLLKHWILICAVAGGILVAVVAWTLLTTPRYQSTAVLRIMDQSQQFGVMEQLADLPGADLMGFGRDDLETEVGVLRSWRITEAVVDSLALMVQVERPAGVRSRVLEVAAQGDPDRQGRLTLRLQSGGGYTVQVKEPDEPTLDLSPVQPGGEVEFAGYHLRLKGDLADDLPGKIRIEILPRYEAVKDLREELDIRRQEGGSRLVDISYTIPDREVAAAVVNGIVDQYVAYKTGAEGFEGRATAQEFEEEVEDYAIRLAEAEEKLRRYQETHQLVAPEEQATQQVRRVAQLQLQDDALRVERDALAGLLGLISERAGSTDPAAYRQLATFPSLISNRGIQDLLLALLDLENERSALLNRRTEENRDVRQLTERIRELEVQLHRLGTDYLESLDGQLASTGGALDRLNAELEALPEREMEYLRLLRDRTMLSEGYLLLERQLRLTEVQNAIRSEGVRIVDTGLVAHEDDPEYPKPLVNLFLGLVLATAAGLGAGLFRDLWDG